LPPANEKARVDAGLAIEDLSIADAAHGHANGKVVGYEEDYDQAGDEREPFGHNIEHACK
jgi:hypothetical protein